MSNSSYEGLALPSAIGAVIFSILIVAVSIYLVVYLMALAANAHLDMADAIVPCSEVVKNIQPTCWYALTVAVVSSLFRITPEEVMAEYTRDVDARTWIVRHTFPQNPLTKRFLSKFSSRFLTNGYDINPQVVSGHLTSHSARSMSVSETTAKTSQSATTT